MNENQPNNRFINPELDAIQKAWDAVEALPIESARHVFKWVEQKLVERDRLKKRRSAA